MAFTFYRLAFGDPLQFYEQLGDPIATQGGAPVPAVRGALRHSVSLATFLPSEPETVAQRLRVRRQFRSLANNTPMKLTAVYLAWDTDPENDGWYIPDQGQLVDLDGASGIATGVFKVENFVWTVAGRPRTHRRAMAIYLKDLRTGLWARDQRRAIYSTDFSSLSDLTLSYFAPGVSDLLSTGTVGATTAHALPSGADGGACSVVEGLQDLARLSYEQPESNRNLGQVIVYDRRGERTAPATGVGAAWEEFYGPDYPYNWLTAEQPIDVPVLQNGRCRVRYDPNHLNGFAIDVWNGAEWEEQGKVVIDRGGNEVGLDEFLLSSSLVEYNETRAVIQAVMRTQALANSREEVFITLQRGWSGPKIEVYPAPRSGGEREDVGIGFFTAISDTDDSVLKLNYIEEGLFTPVTAFTAKGTGHTGKFEGAGLGSFGPSGENQVILARWKGTSEATPYGVIIATFIASSGTKGINTSNAYGVARNGIHVASENAPGYLGVQLGFCAQQNQQAMEAENMTVGTGSTITTDAEGSNGKTVTATRTSDANAHISQATWPNGDQATYRIFARVKTSVGTSKLKIYAKTSATTGATKEATNVTLQWIDLGEVVANNSTLEIHAWLSAAGTLSVDRIESFLIEDRNVAQGGIFEGGRDLGRRILVDSRTTPTIVTRTV